MALPIKTQLTEVQDNWRNLHSIASSRRSALNAAYTSHKFQADLRELQIWVADTIKRMGSSNLPTNLAEAHSLLELHDERKAEIDGRQEIFKTLKEAGLKLNPPPENDLAKLEELRRTLAVAWEDRKQILVQAQKLQIFKQASDMADSWLASKEAFLNNDDLGDSLASVEELFRKHEAFEKTVQAQVKRVDEVEKLGKEVLSEEHYAATQISQILHALTARRDKLKENTNARRKKLNESKKLHQFLRNVYEVSLYF